MLSDYKIVLNTVNDYTTKLSCRKHGRPVPIKEIQYILDTVLYEYSIENINDFTLEHPKIIKIVSDAIEWTLSWCHEYNNDVSDQNFMTYGSRFAFPDYIYPSTREFIIRTIRSYVSQNILESQGLGGLGGLESAMNSLSINTASPERPNNDMDILIDNFSRVL